MGSAMEAPVGIPLLLGADMVFAIAAGVGGPWNTTRGATATPHLEQNRAVSMSCCPH